MARRRKRVSPARTKERVPETAAQIGKHEAAAEARCCEMVLPPAHFNNIIRFARRSHVDRVLALRNATFLTLKRLGVKRNKGAAVSSTPAASDQFDLQSVVTWMGKLTCDHKDAVAQLQVIDATACSRGE